MATVHNTFTLHTIRLALNPVKKFISNIIASNLTNSNKTPAPTMGRYFMNTGSVTCNIHSNNYINGVTILIIYTSARLAMELLHSVAHTDCYCPCILLQHSQTNNHSSGPGIELS